MHHDSAQVIAQAVALASGQALTASDGSALVLRADSLCVHGDNAGSVAAVRSIREALDGLQPA
ncbi:LamB/YcsF family protein [compost metagenome]